MTQSLTTMLKEFHDAFEVQQQNAVNVADTSDWLNFRGELLGEEFTELFAAHMQYANVGSTQEERQKALVELLDALGDIIYVAAGTAQLLGYDIQGAMEEIHASNMSKLGTDGKPMKSDGTDGKPVGKVLKGPNFKEPNLSVFVEHYPEFNTEGRPLFDLSKEK